MSLSEAWKSSLIDIISCGTQSAPRGKITKEILHRTMMVDMMRPVLTVPKRSLNYKFMAAEAFWILTGDDRVETIAPYNSRIKEFSDDGVKFFGAYGPKVVSQINHVIAKIISDGHTRQAGLTIWRENPPETKDYPCTIAIWFTLRDDRIHTHVFMRSSDVWLGIPYDVFNFTMITCLVCTRLNHHHYNSGNIIAPGNLYLTAANSHLYYENWADAEICIGADDQPGQPEIPLALYSDEHHLLNHLQALRQAAPGSEFRWWEK